MNINKNNYEAFFLDYHEGNLTPEQVAEVLLFVEQHPELKEEFENFENFSIDAEELKFENKSLLKKHIDINNIEEYIVLSIEGKLNKAEKDLLNSYLKQHPQHQKTVDLYQKTKLTPDYSIVFESKEDLKRIDAMEELLISSIEGLLSDKENTLLNKQLLADAKLKNDLAIYKQTKLVADNSIVYPNKEELYQKESKVIPLFYYVSAAAAIAIIVGIFALYNVYNKPAEPIYSNIITQPKNNVEHNTNPSNEIKEDNKVVNNSTSINNNALASDNKNVKKSNNNPLVKKDSKVIPIAKEQNQVNIANNNIEVNKKIEDNIKEEKNNQPQIVNNTTLAVMPEERKAKVKSVEYLSLRELAAEKIKEKTLDEKTLEVQKKTGTDKKITGWDIAQIVSKGASKVVGKNLELKPKYNEQGDVIAYALGNGLEFSKGR